MKKQITIRPFEESDRAALALLYEQVRAQTFTWLSEEQIGAGTFDQDTVGEKIWVAQDKSELVGFISLWEPDAFIHHLYVSGQYQGQGIGQQLIECIQKEFTRPLTLKCLVNNAKAVRFYLKNGWLKVREGTSEQGSYLLLGLAAE